MPTEYSLQRAAQAWCKPTTEKLVMIPELAEVFAEILDDEKKKSYEAAIELYGDKCIRRDDVNEF